MAPPLPGHTYSLPTSPSAVLHNLQQKATDLYTTHNHTPFIYPYHALPSFILLTSYLLLPPSLSDSNVVYYARYPIFGIIVYFSVEAILECRSGMVTVGYGIGLMHAWMVLWSACLLVFKDARREFRRIEERVGADGEGDGQVRNGEVVAKGIDGGRKSTVMKANLDDRRLRERHVNGEVEKSSSQSSLNQGQTSGHETKFVWQGLPQTFFHRLDWVLDLITNFRGPRWNHQLSGLPPPPPHIQSSLKDSSIRPPNDFSHLTRADLLRNNLPNFLFYCIMLDVLKTITLQDPYFWSLPSSTPSPFPFKRESRLLLSLVFTYTSLHTIFLLAPLGLGVLLGPRYLGQHAWPWLYPPYFGPVSQIWKKGLAGMWGEWWHQLFRYAFEQVGEVAGRITGWEKKSQRGAALRVAMAFACSGILHACASYTSLGDTRPISGSFAFFMLQPVGIIGQRAFTGWMRKAGYRERLPVWLRQLGNLLVVVMWCYLVGPTISDEFAACGIWLFEPLPISVLRGVKGEGWWRWGGTWVRWHRGDRWWKSGLAF